MAVFDKKAHGAHDSVAVTDLSFDPSKAGKSGSQSKGSSFHDTDLSKNLDSAFDMSNQTGRQKGEKDKGKGAGNSSQSFDLSDSGKGDRFSRSSFGKSKSDKTLDQSLSNQPNASEDSKGNIKGKVQSRLDDLKAAFEKSRGGQSQDAAALELDPNKTPPAGGQSSGSTGSDQDPAPATGGNSGGTGAPVDDHDHAPETSGQSTHVSLDGLEPAKTLTSSNSKNGNGAQAIDLLKQLRSNPGDLLDPGGGNDTVIASGKSDVIFGDSGGTKTITTGSGNDAVILGKETTNRIFDFDPNQDKFVLKDLKFNDIMIAQGKNPGKGGLDQPTDSVNNALIIDKGSGHILGALTFTKADSLSEKNFVTADSRAIDFLRKDTGLTAGFKTQQGDGKLTGTLGQDKLVGGGGSDFLYVGDDGFKIGTAKGTGPGEFPFPNDSPGTTEVNAELKNGVLKVNGNYKNFDAAPLFSQNEKEIDPKAKILNGSDPVSLINGFLKVPQDKEGNPISGTHLHFSPSEDSRGNFADATVVRYFTNTPTDAKSGTITGEFELSSEEQAAFLAGNLYMNVHSNVDVDGDGKAGFPTGENRVNFNQNVVKFA